MSQKNETGTLIAALVITVVILAGGFWWFTRQSGMNLGGLMGGENNSTQNPSPPTQPTNPGTPAANPNSAFAPPQAVPSGTIVRIAGSTSMVQINQALKQSFEQQFQGTTVEAQAGGSDQGIRTLLTGGTDIAAISRPLTSKEQSQGLVAVPVTKDAIAIVVGGENLFQRGLTQAEVQQIFQGQITDWSQVGGDSAPIRVINRPPVSGTRQAFQELVLNGGQFGTTPNIETMQQDATTPILRQLGSDGISYATYAQVADQQTVRIVPVDGLTPEAATYPYQRELYYVYKEPVTPQVQAFLGYVGSPQGQSAIAATNQ
ncbi:phosphate ABC transporter substrate-binding protein [Coleofasciculus sp. E1-EBD-02]|uniref:phosphate ABC transporter substrate-binding protein n=1 Tax=Coleofasciculus sp. E1-EBD-02 TaxID=3068481 RepID=UPI0033051945